MTVIGTAIATSLGLTAAWAGAAIGAGLQILASFGLRAISRLLTPDGDDPESSGLEAQLQLGGSIPRGGQMGEAALAGHLVYANSYGDTNEYLQLVFVLSDGGECEALTGLYIDGEEKTLVSAVDGGTEDARWHVDGYTDKIIIKWYSGRVGQDADGDLVDHANPAGRWTSDDALIGMCYLSVRLEMDAELFSGIPSFVWVFKGLKLYDPRKDSTNGGSGAHRWDNRATWEYSENPAIQRYNYQRGFYVNDRRMLGQGLGILDLLNDLYFTAANICDEDVALDAGGTQKRYASALYVTDDRPHHITLDLLDAAMGGFGVERQGAFGPIAGAAYSTVATITDGDLVDGESKRFRAKLPRSELFNAVFGQVRDPDANWEMNTFPPILSPALEAEDKDRRLVLDLTLQAVTNMVRGRRIGLLRRNESRSQATADITLGLRHVWLEAGDWLRWNSARYGDLTYRIVSRTRTGSGSATRCRLSLREVNADNYDWTTGDEEASPAAPSPGLPGTRPTTVAGFTIAATTISGTAVTGETATAVPGLLATWVPVADATVDEVVVRYRKVGDTGWQQISSREPEGGTLLISPVLPGEDYEAQATIRTTPYRPTTWGSVSTTTSDPNWIVTSVANLQASFDDLDAEMQMYVALLWGDGPGSVQGTFDDLRERIERVALDAAQGYGHTSEQTIENKVSMVARYEANVAAITLEQVARADADSALASSVLVVQANVDDVAADVLTEQTARANADSALAADITAVEATAADATASGLVKLEATSGPSGASATFGVFLRASTGGGYVSTAAMILQIVGATTRAVFNVDQFLVFSGANNELAFAYSGGIFYLGANVYAQKIIADVIEANHIKTNAIETAKINGLAVTTAKVDTDAITQFVNALTTGSVSVPSETTAQTIAITRRTASVLDAQIGFQIETFNASGEHVVQVKFKRDGTDVQIYEAQVPLVKAGTNDKGGFFTLAGVDDTTQVGAKSYTYTVRVFEVGGTNKTVNVLNRYMRILERLK